MPTSIRLDRETDRALEEIATRRQETKSEVVRRAIADLVARESASVYERATDLIGSVRGGAPDLSERTGRRFRELLETRR